MIGGRARTGERRKNREGSSEPGLAGVDMETEYIALMWPEYP